MGRKARHKRQRRDTRAIRSQPDEQRSGFWCEPLEKPTSSTGQTVDVAANGEIVNALRTSLLHRIAEITTRLGYSTDLSGHFMLIVDRWFSLIRHTDLSRLSLGWPPACKSVGRADPSETQTSSIEQRVMSELVRVLRQEFAPVGTIETSYDLTEVFGQRRANCLGFSQLFYVLSNAVGFDVRTLRVYKMHIDMPAGDAHVVCLAYLSDGRQMMVDVSLDLVSEPFAIDEMFRVSGRCLVMNGAGNPLRLHRVFKEIDEPGIVAGMHCNRGNWYYSQGQYRDAISEFSHAIALDSDEGIHYVTRAAAYMAVCNYDQAEADCYEAVKLNQYIAAHVYCNLGLIYHKRGHYTKALEFYTMSIAADPTLAIVYNNRGNVLSELSNYEGAIAEYDKAIDISPGYYNAYMNREEAERRLKAL